MAAREASLRGLRTALVERDDFGSGTSYNSLKIVHRGVRSVQHLGIARLRSSARERAFWQRAAPDLVRPLEFVIPLIGHGIKGPAAFAAAAALYSLLSTGVRGPGYGGTRVIGSAEAGRRLGDLAPEGLAGGGVWRDGQILDVNRLQLSCLRAATDAGAEIANYVEVDTFLRQDDRVVGASVTDRVSEETADIRAGVTLSCLGVAASGLASPVVGPSATDRFPQFARALNLVIDRPFGPRALGTISRSRSDAVVDRGGRMYFLTRGKDGWSLGRMKPLIVKGHDCAFGDQLRDSALRDHQHQRRDDLEVADFLDEMNQACPSLDLSPNAIGRNRSPSERHRFSVVGGGERIRAGASTIHRDGPARLTVVVHGERRDLNNNLCHLIALSRR